MPGLNRFRVAGLVAGMIITGACNSIWSKYQDMQCVENCDDPDSSVHVLYEQPFWQTLQMFAGEMLCFLPVLAGILHARITSGKQHVALPDEDADEPLLEQPVKRPADVPLTGWRVLLLWLPAICDLTGTTLMNIGLLYTPVSIYQMTRGALVLFVGVGSVIFLRRRLWLYQWISLVTVMAGVTLVGYSGSLVKETLHEATALVARAIGLDADTANGMGMDFSGGASLFGPGLVDVSAMNVSMAVDKAGEEPTGKPEATKVLIGVFFILFAQIFTATQFVLEEKILSRYTVEPLLAVGFEGFFGALSIVILLPLLPLIHVSPTSPAAAWLDLPRGWAQLINNPAVLWSGVLVACSIAFFNFFGLSVTKHVSATVRSLTDTCRTLAIWVVSLAIGWEALLWPTSVLQVLGFTLLVYGTFMFNGLVSPPPFLRASSASEDLPAENLATTDVEAAVAPRESIEESLDHTARLPSDIGRGYEVEPEAGAGAGKRSSVGNLAAGA
ncbi:hypothetical protein PENSPDRAFT_652188 [Peniophora sp. CONT]|nr:hypothetical protein PENSPDRAFT_652188 [Peniophora sp. CONT]